MPPVLTHASYDEVPYDAGLSSSTHPQTAAVIGRLFGLRTPDVTNARVLEIGCGTGNNLLPMAYSLPAATFVGLDLSGRQIAAAQDAAGRLGVRNTRFLQGDVCEYEPDETFDYIICHGVFSWVPPDARNAILDVCRRSLSERGIAHISYNAMPGWHVRGAFRDMLRAHARFFGSPQERVEQARAFASFLVESTGQLTSGAPSNAAYHAMLQEELALIERLPDFYLQHEHLAEDNHPFYFLDFVDELDSHGLRYLGDANFASMLTQNLPREVAASLDETAPTREVLEQYRDFVVDRHFRQSLVVREEVVLDPHLNAAAVRQFSVRAALTAPTDGAWHIPQAAGMSRQVESPLVVSILQTLADNLPLALSFQALYATVDASAWPADIAEDDRESHLAAVLLSLFASDAVSLRCWEPALSTTVGQRPSVFLPARVLDTTLGFPTAHHMLLGFDSPARWLLPNVDGTRTRDDMVALLLEQAEQGRISLEGMGPATSINGDMALSLVRDGLEQLRRSGMLEAEPPAPGDPR